MKLKSVGLLIMVCLLMPAGVFAVDCAQLNSDQKIKAFIQAARELLPIHRSEVSAQLNVSPCEKQECAKKNINMRRKKASLLHIVRKDQYARNYFIKGQNHPSCLVSKDYRKFRCIACSAKLNDQCRTYAATSSIEGTNLDSEDLKSLGSDDYQYSCESIPKMKGYFKIVATKIKGDSPYNKISEYFEAKRQLLVKIDYYQDNILRKVYSIFPKNYIKVDNNWVATKIRVRTVQGKENRYVFETLLQIRKQKNKDLIYFDPTEDPFLKGVSIDHLFITN